MDSTRNRTLLGVAIGHGAHDAWYGVAPILLASLSVTMGLSNQDIALILLLYQLLSSLTQPFFGTLAERIGGRPLAVGSILWTTALYTGAFLAESPLLLGTFICLAGLGSGAWHPQGTATATIAGGKRWGATAAAFFFLGGTLGSAFLGAALGGTLIASYGRQSLVVVSAITALLALTVVRAWVPRRLEATPRRATSEAAPRTPGARNAFWGLLALLMVGLALRSLVQHSLATFYPKYQQDMGVSADVYGLVVSLNMVALAGGSLLGGYLADRVGLRRILVSSIILGAAFLVLFLRSGGWVSAAAFVVAGLFYGPSHTLMLVAGQRQFPERMAMMAGVFLGFTFVTGAGGAWVLGLLADRFGLPQMLDLLPWTLLAAAVFAYLALPRRVGSPAAEGATGSL